MPRQYVPKAIRDAMTPERYAELCAFCQGYNAAKAQLARKKTLLPHAVGDELDQLEHEIAGLASDVSMIERAARETAGGGWYQALMLCVCGQVAYECLQPRGVIVPSHHHGA